MQITSDVIQALQTAVDRQFQTAYGRTEQWYTQLTSTIPSSVSIQTYAWLKRIPKMREWLGPRVVQNIANHDYQIKNRTWELTVGVDREEIEDDSLGMFTGMTIPALGEQAALLPQLQVTERIEDTVTLGFDGLTFFNASHPLDRKGPVQSNLKTGRALNTANYELSFAEFGQTKGEDGLPMSSKVTHLLVAPKNEIIARRILHAGLIADPGGVAAGVENVMTGSAKLVVSRELINQDNWYLIDASNPIKPWIWQERRATELTSMTNLTDANVFALDRYLWGVSRRGASGSSLWWLAQKNTL